MSLQVQRISPFKYLGAFTDNTTSLTYTGIPSGYTHLRVVWVAQSNRAGFANTGGRVLWNGLTANYTIFALNTLAAMAAQTSGYVGQIPAGNRASDAYVGLCVLDFPFYARTDTMKGFQCVQTGHDGTNPLYYYTNTHNTDTAAITSITLRDDVTGNLGPKRQATLYGY